MTGNIAIWAAFYFVIIGLGAGCGESQERTDQRQQVAADAPETIDSLDPYTVRATWRMSLGSPTPVTLLLGSGQSDIPIEATVAANVRFDVDTSGFLEPSDPEEVESYGVLDISDLRDNDLSACGANQDERCTVAGIRVYTTGTPGAGLWNAEEGYGIPILTDGNEIGLAGGGEQVVASFSIDRRRVVRLADFNRGQGVSIPIDVDFTDAGAGTFATTLVVEYIAQ